MRTVNTYRLEGTMHALYSVQDKVITYNEKRRLSPAKEEEIHGQC